MNEYTKHNKAQRWGVIIGLSFLMVMAFSCKSSTGPDDRPEDALVTVSNETGVTVDIFMDGIYQFTIDDLDYNQIEHVSLQTHELVAKRAGTEIIVTSVTKEFTDNIAYLWTVRTSAYLTITNQVGETVTIQQGSNVIATIEDQNTYGLSNMPYGSYTLKAIRESNGYTADTLSIDIEENKEYIWIITP